MNLAHVVESTVGTGAAMVLYQLARKVAAELTIVILRRRLDLRRSPGILDGNTARPKNR